MCERWIGQYQVLQTLGKGKFAKVKLGINHNVDPPQKVALKMIDLAVFNEHDPSINHSENHAMIKQAEREIKALSSLNHQSIIKLIDIIWSASYPKKHQSNNQSINQSKNQKQIILIVLEYAGGGELFEYLNLTGKFEEKLARTFFHQLINGVSFAHGLSFAHRDLKPENILLDDFFCLKIADFGLSNSINQSNNQTNLMFTECGTLSYLDPAVLSQSNNQSNNQKCGYDPFAADLWSCGVILFTMVAGFPPFSSPSMTDWWFNKLAQKKYDLFWAAHSRSVPFSTPLKIFLSKLLTVDPKQRMKTCDMTSYEWFCGESLNLDCLIDCLKSRKSMIDASKLREKFEHDQKQREDDMSFEQSNNQIDYYCEDHAIYRSHQSNNQSNNQSNKQSNLANSDELPLANPCVIYGHMARAQCQPLTTEHMVDAFESFDLSINQTINQTNNQSINQSNNHLTILTAADLDDYHSKDPTINQSINQSDNQTDHLSDHQIHNQSINQTNNQSNNQISELSLPLYDDQTIKCLTFFETNSKIDYLIDRLIGLIERNHFTIKIKSNGRFKVYIDSPTGLVTMNIQIYRNKQSNNQTNSRWLVQFRRLTGDASQFRELFADMLLQLVD